MKQMSAQESEYVEQFGRFWEASGGSRTAGRIVGWLMICEPVQQSAADLVNVLGVSSGSVSTLTRQLMNVQMVERVTFPSDRASYYQLHEHVWIQRVGNGVAAFEELARLARQGRDLLPDARADRVDELGAVMAFFLAEWPALMDRLHEHMRERVTAGRTLLKGPHHE